MNEAVSGTPPISQSDATKKEARQIAKLPVCPRGLSTRAEELITKLCFRPDTAADDDNMMGVDSIFVFGTTTGVDTLASIVSNLLHQVMPNVLVITGGIPKYQDSWPIQQSEASLLLSRLPLPPLPSIQCWLEEVSRNSQENVVNAEGYLSDHPDSVVMIVPKAHSSWRQYLTFKKTFPSSIILQKSWSAQYTPDPVPITAENWMTYGLGRSRMWGEVIRFQKYTQQGHLARNPYTDQTFLELVGLVPELRRTS